MAIKEEYKQKAKKIKDFIFMLCFIIVLFYILKETNMIEFTTSENNVKVEFFGLFYSDFGIMSQADVSSITPSH